MFDMSVWHVSYCFWILIVRLCRTVHVEDNLCKCERFHVFVRVCICTPFLCWYYYIVFKNRIIDTCHGITCASWYSLYIKKNIWRENSSHLGQPRQRMQQKLWCVRYRSMFGVVMANRVRDRARLGFCLGAWARSRHRRHLALLRNMTFSMPMPSVWSKSKMNSKAMEFKIWSWEQCACCASCTVWFSDSDSLKLCLLCIVLSRAKAKMEKRAKMAKAVIALGPVQAREIERLLLGIQIVCSWIEIAEFSNEFSRCYWIFWHPLWLCDVWFCGFVNLPYVSLFLNVIFFWYVFKE